MAVPRERMTYVTSGTAATSTYTRTSLASWSPAVALDAQEERQARFLITTAVRCSGIQASAVSALTKKTAREFLRLTMFACDPGPEITVEPTGEIEFEWYKDRDHVAVVTADGALLRWAAASGPGVAATSGVAMFDGQVPAEVLAAIVATAG